MDRFTNPALLIVDMQNDFSPTGALPVNGSDQVVGDVNRYLHLFQSRSLPIIATRDWHSSPGLK